MVKKLFFLLLVLTSFNAKSQDISFYCDVMANAYEAKHRLYASEKFNEMIKVSLEAPSSFDNSYSELKWVSIKYNSDKSFRILTWQVEDQDKNYKYYGYVQTKEGGLFELQDKSRVLTDGAYMTVGPEEWFGALYYNMIERKVGDKTRYFLFGYNGWTEDVQIKVIDEIFFENGKPYFGQEGFKHLSENSRDDIKSRVIIDYADIANANCNYNDAMGMIVHDFVVSKFGVVEGGKPVKIPDGTYVGYKWENDVWVCIPQLAHEISTPESIMYEPKPKESSDILGRPNTKRRQK